MKEYRKRQIEVQKSAVPLGGKREDIVGVSFGLSEGDIKSPVYLEDCPRKEYVRAVLSFDRYSEREDMEAAINEFWANCMGDLQKLRSTEIHVVELPQKIIRKDHCIVEYRSWGEVEPQLFGTFSGKEKVLTEKEVRDPAGKWQLLKDENSLLRVVKNGSVISADIDYYDDLIRKEFPKETCKIAYIIGSALGKQKIPTGDVFIAKRIQHFINNGELVALEKAGERFYSTIVACPK